MCSYMPNSCDVFSSFFLLCVGVLLSTKKHPRTKDLSVSPFNYMVWWLFLNNIKKIDGTIKLHYYLQYYLGLGVLGQRSEFSHIIFVCSARRVLVQCTKERDNGLCTSGGAWFDSIGWGF